MGMGGSGLHKELMKKICTKCCPTCNTSKGNKLLGLEWVPPYRADAPKISLAFL